MKNDILCRECSERYGTRLREASNKTSEVSHSAQALLEPSRPDHSLLEKEQLIQPTPGRLRNHSTLIGYVVLGLGLVVLAISIVLSSTILSFIGLGLTFWGMLVFFIQPSKYVRSDLLDATARSSLKTVDKMMVELGYREKGVYIPAQHSNTAVVFIPSEPFSRIPESIPLDGDIFLKNPDGLVVVPPGLALSSLIERKLGFDLKNCGIDALVRSLPKVLVEDLEIAREVEIDVNGERVDFKLHDSIYADFCKDVHDNSRRCGMGCPMCSALACVLAVATGKPVLFDEDKVSADTRVSESSYQVLNRTRL